MYAKFKEKTNNKTIIKNIVHFPLHKHVYCFRNVNQS